MSARFFAFLLVFVGASAFANEVGRTNLSLKILDESMKPIEGAKISGVFKKSIVSGGFFSSTVTEENESLTCTTDASGICIINAPLKKTYSWLDLSGEAVDVALPTGKLIKFKEKSFIWESFYKQVTKSEKLIYVDGDVAHVSRLKNTVALSEVIKKVEVKNDDLDTSITLNTLKTRSLWTTDNEFSDITFIRAWIDKSNNSKRFQIYSLVDHDGPGWNFYQAANYKATSGIRSIDVVKIESKPYHSNGKMRYIEQVGFSVPEDLLREYSANFIDGSDKSFNFRLVAKSGRDKDFRIYGFEITALMAKIDELSQKNVVNK